MEEVSGHVALHDYNRAIRDIAASADWQSGRVDRQVGWVVEVAARSMGVSRVSVWFLQPDWKGLDCACQYDSRHGLVESGQSLDAGKYPVYFAALANNRVLAVNDARHDAMTQELASPYLEQNGITALLDAPIWLNGEMVGVLCHEHTGSPRVWRDEDIAFAGSMGDFVSMALSQDRYQRMAAAHERLARIIEATPDMVAIVVPGGQIIQMNPAGRMLLGLSDDADISCFNSRDFLGEKTTRQLDTEILPALMEAGQWTGEVILREGSVLALPVSVVVLTHRNATGQLEYYSVSLRDLSAQKAIQREIGLLNSQLEARVRTRTQELEQANRNLESFAYSVSHDLKAPLRGIEGYSQLLTREYRGNLPEDAREYIDLILLASQRMDRMIEDILAYSRVQIRALKPVRIDVRELVQQVVGEFEAQLREGAELALDIEAGELVSDREGLLQVLRNFLSNALKFSQQQSPPRIRVEGRRQPQAYRFAVHDNGMGFDMRYHDRIFEIFHRLPGREEQAGTGIGLALATRAAERLGGRVWAESAPGHGATFFLELGEGTQA